MPSSAKKSKPTTRALKVWFTEEHICLKLADVEGIILGKHASF